MLAPLASDDPREVGPFTLDGRLGATAIGRVYLGHAADGAEAAVTLVRSDLADDPEFRQRFAREVASIGLVHGHHTAALLGADPEAAHPWLATEYLAAPSLREVISERGPLPVPEVIEVTAGVADSLATIHAAGLAHRDLRADTVLLLRDGPRVIGTAVGTPAPEHAEGEAADVFALGVLIAYLATGQPDPPVADLPEPVRGLAARCLATDPAHRPKPAQIAEYCRPGDPLAYQGTRPPANPLDLSAGIPYDAIVGPISADATPDPPEPITYSATDPPENPLDLSAGIPDHAIVGPIPADPIPEVTVAAESTTVEVGAGTPTITAAPGGTPGEPPIEIHDLVALRAAADVVAAAASVAAADAVAMTVGPHSGAGHTIEPVEYADADKTTGPPHTERRRHRRRRALLLAGLAAAFLIAAAISLPIGHDDPAEEAPVVAESAVPAPTSTATITTTNTTAPTCTGAKSLHGSGSALQHDAMITIAEQWAARCAGSTVEYTAASTEFGVHQFATGETDFAAADHVLGASEGEIASAAARCAGVGAPANKNLVVQVPVVLTPIALAYHLPGVTELRLDAPALSAIFSGQVVKWNDRTIAALNPGTRLPATAIVVVARADEAVSTETFQQYLTATGGWRSGDGPEFTGKAAITPRSDTDMLATIRAVVGTIGYLPYPATRPTEEPVATLLIGDGKTGRRAATLDPDAVNAAMDAGMGSIDDFTQLPDAIFRAGTEQSDDDTTPYPLVHVGYVVACTQYPDDHTTAAIRDYLFTALGMQVESASGYQLPFGALRLGLVDLVDRTY